MQCSPSQPLLVRNDSLSTLIMHATRSVILSLHVHRCPCTQYYDSYWGKLHLLSLHYTVVGAPTIMTVTGESSIFLEWSPPSEGSPLSYTVTWTGSGVTSSVVLPPTARNYTIRGLDSNTAYSGTVEVYSLANTATVSWGAHTLPQGEWVCPERCI